MPDNQIKKITSFTVDHTTMKEGLYISRKDGSIVTYDMRTRRPNAGDYMDNLTMHSFEHMFATYIRNSQLGERIVYFGPMGCQTGFYLLADGVENSKILHCVKETLKKIIAHEGEIFGKSERECGNYRNLSLQAAQKEAHRYLDILENTEVTFNY